MASSRLDLRMPSTADVWRRIGLSFYFLPSEFSEGQFRDALGRHPRASRWLIWDDGAEVHSHATLERMEPRKHDEESATGGEPAAQAPEYALFLRITAYPSSPDVDQEVKPEGVDHATFFDALMSAVPEEDGDFAALCSVDLYYPTPPAEWRVPLLAHPPAFDEMSKEFGRISLAGMTLRFQDSPQPLFEVSLESSPDGKLLYVAPRFGILQARDDVENIFQDSLRQAKEIADAFVVPGSDSSEEEER